MIIVLIVIVMTGAGFLAGRLTTSSKASGPARIVTKTVTATPTSAASPANQISPTQSVPGSSPAGGTSTVGDGTQVGAYSFKLTQPYSAPLGTTAPTQSEIVYGSGGTYDIYLNGSLFAGPNERMLGLPSGSTPSFSSCTSDTVFVNNASAVQGSAFCIEETSGRMAGVTVSSVNQSPYYVVVKITLWKNVS